MGSTGGERRQGDSGVGADSDDDGAAMPPVVKSLQNRLARAEEQCVTPPPGVRCAAADDVNLSHACLVQNMSQFRLSRVPVLTGLNGRASANGGCASVWRATTFRTCSRHSGRRLSL